MPIKGSKWAPAMSPGSVRAAGRSMGAGTQSDKGLADFAVVQSYLSTAAKWGIDQLDALTQLFTDGPWLPNAIRPG